MSAFDPKLRWYSVFVVMVCVGAAVLVPAQK